jgi:hypothetical protein
MRNLRAESLPLDKVDFPSRGSHPRDRFNALRFSSASDGDHQGNHRGPHFCCESEKGKVRVRVRAGAKPGFVLFIDANEISRRATEVKRSPSHPRRRLLSVYRNPPFVLRASPVLVSFITRAG